MMSHKIWTQSDKKSKKTGVIAAESPYHAQIWEYPFQVQGATGMPTCQGNTQCNKLFVQVHYFLDFQDQTLFLRCLKLQGRVTFEVVNLNWYVGKI